MPLDVHAGGFSETASVGHVTVPRLAPGASMATQHKSPGARARGLRRSRSREPGGCPCSSLQVLDLLPQSLDPRLCLDDGMGDFDVGTLGGDGVGFAGEFLRQKIELPARRLLIQKPLELVEVALEPNELFRDVGAVGDEDNLAGHVGVRQAGAPLGKPPV